VIANVGDSRTYLLRAGELRQLSVDHSYVQELVTEGLLTAEEAHTHPRRNIVTRALGIDAQVSVDTWTMPMFDGDRFMLCSDGLVDEVPLNEITELMQEHSAPQQVAERLVTAAKRHGGRDNITVIVVSTASPDAEVVVPVEEPPSPISPPRDSDNAPVLVMRETPAKKKFRFGPVLFWSALGGIVLAVLVVFAAYGRTGYFVSFQGDDVVVLKGRPGGVLWFNPTVEARTTLTRGDLTDSLALEIAGEPTFSESSAAQTYVNGIRDEVQPNPTTTLPAVVTTTSSTSTTSSTTSTVVE
jgi:hypothetical protein